MCVYVKYSNMPARYVHILLYFIMIYYIHNVIRECGTTLYVGLGHAAPPNQYKAFTAFSTNWLSEGSTSRYTCKEQWISGPR